MKDRGDGGRDAAAPHSPQSRAGSTDPELRTGGSLPLSGAGPLKLDYMKEMANHVLLSCHSAISQPPLIPVKPKHL